MADRLRKRRLNLTRLSMLGLLAAATYAFALRAEKPLSTVRGVDLQRYQGKWYEIVRLPLFWEKKCVSDVTATYTLRQDGKITVLNACRKADGSFTNSRGTAVPATTDGSFSKLKVTFFWPFAGDYWILDLDPEYRWALVGTPDRKHLWVLSRTPQLSAQTLNVLLNEARDQGFDMSRMITTAQSKKEELFA